MSRKATEVHVGDERGLKSWMSIKRVVALLIAVLIYAISPVDAMPEAVMGPAGLVDDFLVAGSWSLYSLLVFVVKLYILVRRKR